MENDSPNLFDSEPMSVNLTVVKNSEDDILDENIENNEPSKVENVNNEIDSNIVQDTVEYQTDESGDENDTEDQLVDADHSVDQSTEQQSENSLKTKTKDTHKGLPPGRVKLIMKMDPDVNIIAGDAVFLVTKATVNTIFS